MSKLLKRIRDLRVPSTSFKPSESLIAVLLIVISIFIMGGGVYNITQKDRLVTVLPTPSNPVFYYPGLSDQTLNESVIFILFLIIGISGGYLSFSSTSRAYRAREAKMFLTIGVTLMMIAFIGCEIVMAWKGLSLV